MPEWILALLDQRSPELQLSIWLILRKHSKGTFYGTLEHYSKVPHEAALANDVIVALNDVSQGLKHFNV